MVFVLVGLLVTQTWLQTVPVLANEPPRRFLTFYAQNQSVLDLVQDGLVNLLDLLRRFRGTAIPTASPTAGPIGPTSGIWISSEELRTKEASGAGWDNLQAAADSLNPTASALYNQDSKHPQYTLGAALVYAKTNNQTYRNNAKTAVLAIMDDTGSTGGGDGRSLGLGRNLAAYVIAADLINLAQMDSSADSAFKQFLRQVREKKNSEGRSLIECHEVRPNNWGTMCGASRIATALYLRDTADLARAVLVFQGFIGDTSKYNSFVFQSNASKYACGPLRPINPVNCKIIPPGCSTQQYDFSGAEIDDVQRELDSGSGSCPPVTHYAWGGFSALVAQAEMLYRAGYDSYNWQDRAIYRGMQFLSTVMPSSASAPTDWMVWVVNKRYGASFPAKTPVGDGRLLDFADWTHR